MARNTWAEDVNGIDVAKGLVAGVAGGLAGAWMMNRYHTLVSRIQGSDGEEGEEGQGGREADGQEFGGGIDGLEPGEYGGDGVLRSAREVAQERVGSGRGEDSEGDDEEPATEKAAAAVVTGVFGYELRGKEKRIAGSVMHYGFGATMGGAYGVLAEATPRMRVGMGAPYGAGVWLVADEVAVPAIGLSKPPQEHPASTHINALLVHLVFGITLEVVRRMVRSVL